MENSTSIHDLPSDPSAKPIFSNSIPNSNSLTLDQTTINQIVNGLQQASVSGATQLPSRDIAMTSNSLTQDPQIQPNYIPQVQFNQTDYIQSNEHVEDMIHNYNKNMKQRGALDSLYSEIQLPLLLAVLYFLFQLPIFRKTLFSYFPILFSNDGNFTLYGYFFSSALFGILYYLFIKIHRQFGVF
jgi:hypothetical protein